MEPLRKDGSLGPPDALKGVNGPVLGVTGLRTASSVNTLQQQGHRRLGRQERVESRHYIIGHDALALGEHLDLVDGPGFPDIEEPKQQKGHEHQGQEAPAALTKSDPSPIARGPNRLFARRAYPGPFARRRP